ncbi:SRPBCC family protein [Paenibacillus paeoniae]|uniref:Activator of Hsp90 ATPase 1 family protein n=1 Tax=Paenibacillus paeoniae TaxID=2292705 RepID=A0A371P7J4_9BACL|nr:SRPBCC family protein [Paenibacillus paeoniae]REK71913.1 activator of Hsp90 ATPase 1 family protein [Paenibacillus paeoniae]
MLAVLRQAQGKYIARFERQLKHAVEKAWATLTDNDQLKEWFPELHVDDLREGGVIKFDMGDDTFEEMAILELKEQSVLEYTWGEDQVRFELYPESAGCRLVFIETINQLTDHTPKDLAGWHICLDVIEALLAGKTIESREGLWEIRYKEYAQLIDLLQKS